MPNPKDDPKSPEWRPYIFARDQWHCRICGDRFQYSGSIKLIAVASAKRLAEFSDVPTVAETIPGFQATGWAVLVAPIGTPEAIIDKVSEDLRKVTLDPELQRKLAPLGSYTNPMSAAETTAFVHKQQQTWQPILDEIAKNQP